MSRKNSHPHGGLKRQLDNHWRVNEIEYEFIARSSWGISIADMTRQLWFANGWRDRLETLRKEQRKDGIKDAEFLHPSQSKKSRRR